MFMLTNDEFEAMKVVAYDLLFEIVDFKTLTSEQKDMILRSDNAIIEAISRKRKTNKRTREYIAEKRKVDKNYARKKEE